MTIQEVIKRIGIGKLQAFYRFMRGQTVGIDKDGMPNYYEQDVNNFLRNPRIDSSIRSRKSLEDKSK